MKPDGLWGGKHTSFKNVVNCDKYIVSTDNAYIVIRCSFKAYSYSLRVILRELHGAIAHMNVSRGIAEILFRFNLSAAESLTLNIVFDLSRLTTRLLEGMPPQVGAISQDYLGGLILYDPAWLENGYRAALITFEAELMRGDAASDFWRVLLRWTASWRYDPENYTVIGGLVVNKFLAGSFKKLVEKSARNAELVDKVSLILPEEGYFELNLTLEPGRRLILAILHLDSESINVTVLRGAAMLERIVTVNHTTLVSVAGDGTVTLGLRADPDSVITGAYVEVYSETTRETTTQTVTVTVTVTTTTTTVTITETTTSTVTATETVTATKLVPSTTTVTTTVTERIPVTKTVHITTTIVKTRNATITLTYTREETRTITVTTTSTTTKTVTVAGTAQTTTYVAAALAAGLAIGFLLSRKH